MSLQHGSILINIQERVVRGALGSQVPVASQCLSRKHSGDSVCHMYLISTLSSPGKSKSL